MKDNNNKRMNNQGRNNNHCITFVEHISDVIRRNSTAPQFIGGDFAIVNGDVEAVVTVNCSNAVYRASVSESTLPRPYFTPNLGYVYVPSVSCSSKDHEKMPAEEKLKGWGCVGGKSEECKDCDGCNLPIADSAETDKYHVTSNEVIEALKNNEDVLVNTLIALQHLKKFESLEFSNSEVWKNGECLTNSSIEYVLANYFGVDKGDAKSIAHEISDCVSLDVFKVIAKNKKVYIVAGNVETGIETYDSNSGEKSQVFIATALVRHR